MTRQEVSAMIKAVGVPYAYYEFPVDEDNPAPPPPFICFYLTESDDFYADDVNYASFEALVVELYTEEKDFDLERAVEAQLAANNLTWTREEEDIESERMYMTTYRMEVLINV